MKMIWLFEVEISVTQFKKLLKHYPLFLQWIQKLLF